MTRTCSLAFLLLSAVAAHAMNPGQQMDMQMRQMQHGMFMGNIPYTAPLTRMRVYLKDGPKNPPLDSFRLVQGERAIWRYENEAATFKKGAKISHRIYDLDSVVLEDSSMGFPAPNGLNLLFLQQAGAITQYGLAPKPDGMPAYLRKGDGKIVQTSIDNIRELVADDPEASGMIDFYTHRWAWRGGIMAAGAALVGTGLALAVATEVEDESGERKPSTPVPGIIVLAGLTTFVVPLTPILDFIWNPLPRRSLDTYNRNRAAAP